MCIILKLGTFKGGISRYGMLFVKSLNKFIKNSEYFNHEYKDIG